MNRTELTMRNRQIAAVVDSNPVEIVITRAGSTKTPAGGWVKSAPASLAPQTVTIVNAKRRFANGVVNSEVGDVQLSELVVIGPKTLDIQVDDEFDANGDHYRVTAIDNNKIAETWAGVQNVGAPNRGE